MNELMQIHQNVDHPSDKWSNYFDIYEKHLKDYRGKNVTLVEVGVQKGGSLDMWHTYFGPDSKIIGIDVDPECAKLIYPNKNISVTIGNQESPAFWDEFLSNNTDIDIFIDDGGHTMGQQIVTFEKVFPKLKTGSIFICEDTHTSYFPEHNGGLKKDSTFIEYAKDFIDILHRNWRNVTTESLEKKSAMAFDGLSGLYFYDSVVVFEKFGKQPMNRIMIPGKQ
jgi:hypothetical protein